MDFQLSDYQRDLVASVRELVTREFCATDTAADGSSLPKAALQVVARHGFAGITLPAEDGGQGGQLLDAVLAIEAAAEASPLAGDVFQALNFGAIQQLGRHGAAEVKARYLADCLSGRCQVSIAMSEPDAGSAVTDLTTRATISGDTVSLRGAKLFTSFADTADIFVVWVKFGDSVRTAGAVVVERDAPGFTIDLSHRFMSGDRYGALYFDDCRVPAASILVREDGFRKLLTVFNVERLGNASRSLALGQAACDVAVRHARERRQFGSRLADFQGLQWRFAEMRLKLESARLLLYRAAANADAGVPSATETALAKLACNRAGFEVANDALQILGGYGYDADSTVNYIFRKTRGWLIAGGSAEQMLNRIAEGVFDERFSQRRTPAAPAGADARTAGA